MTVADKYSGSGRAAGVVQSSGANDAVLDIEGLGVAFNSGKEELEVLRGVNLQVRAGETVGLVGESGSGKTITAMAAMGLVGILHGRITAGTIRLSGKDVTHLPEKEWRAIRGSEVAMVFQQPMRSLNPAITVGEQVAEGIRLHLGMTRRAAWLRTIELFDLVGIPHPAQRAKQYPHQFSGGMSQRVVIAMALSCEPKLLIADEPTTALDVTTQRRILLLLERIIAETGVAVLYISHDLAVVSQLCSSVNVMYAGELVEAGPAEAVFDQPLHPYTSGLLGCIPRPGRTGRLIAIEGTVPPAGSMPTGCRFHPRCSFAEPGTCDAAVPQLRSPSARAERSARCLRSDELRLPGAF